MPVTAASGAALKKAGSLEAEAAQEGAKAKLFRILGAASEPMTAGACGRVCVFVCLCVCVCWGWGAGRVVVVVVAA